MINIDYSTGLKCIRRQDKLSCCTPNHRFVRLTLSEMAEFLYKTMDYYALEFERSLLWDDPALGIHWPFAGEPKLAAKDAVAKRLNEAETFA